MGREVKRDGCQAREMCFESQIHLTQPSRARFFLSLNQLLAVLLLGVNEIIHAEKSLWHLTRLQKMEVGL